MFILQLDGPARICVTGERMTPQASTHNPLLSTKLFIPPARPGRAARARLIERMNEAVKHPLTLICAPAGYGKTTMLSEWIPQNEHCVTWVSLDEGDNDPVLFWRYFIAALQTLDGQLCKSAQGILESTYLQNIEPVLSLVINELAGLDYRFSLVLDDYHLVGNPLIDSSLTFLIEHLPHNVTLVICSRRDPALPLARWRARRTMAEIRSADLRFTREETTQLLNQVMKLDLSAPEIAALDDRTEGWIAGLQLAALSIKDHQDRSEFISAFTGSHRFIIDYLVDEVLGQQAEPVREFLLSTSVLKRMCAPLCNALTGRLDGQAALESLEQDNLFVVPLDDHRGWYRYHQLFAEVLQARLLQIQPEMYTEMNCRASKWFERQGLIDQAFRYAVAAPDLERAASLVERNSISMIQRSEVFLIRSWLEILPVEFVQTRPRLVLAQGWTLVLTGQGHQLERWLAGSSVSAAMSAPGLPDEVAGELALLRATLARFRREPARSLELAHQALEHLSGDERGLQAGAMYTIGAAQLQMGEIQAASKAFAAAVELGETKGGPYMALISLQELSEILYKQGQLTHTIQTCRRADRMAVRWGWQTMPAAGLARIYAGQVFYQRNELVRAARELTEGLDLLQGSIEQFILAQGFVALAMVQQASGDIEGAFATIQRGKDWFTRMNVADTGAGTLLGSGEIRLRIFQDDLNAAIHWAQDSTWLPEDTEPGYQQAVTLVRMRLALIRRKLEESYVQEGTAITSRLLVLAESRGWWGQVIELSLLRALIYQAQGVMAKALLDLAHALTLAGPEGYQRVFLDEGAPVRLLLLDYQGSLMKKMGAEPDNESLRLMEFTNELLAAFSAAPSLEISNHGTLFEPLSQRELTILRLIASGRTNQEIADLLVIAVSTVKSHINHLYGKLGADRRTQAIAIARELGLLAE